MSDSTKRFCALVLAAAGAALIGRRVLRADAPDVLDADQVRSIYDRLAPAYDAVAWIYDLAGAGGFHRRAVRALCLRPGDTAVDLACGTGVNLAHLVEAVGPTGRVVGVDLSPRMLARARRRAQRRGWRGVELVCADVRDFAFPQPLHGVVSTYGLEMVPDHDSVVARAVAALAPGGRIAVGGLRHPDRWPDVLVRVAEWTNRPFGVSRAYEDVQPWHALFSHAQRERYDEFLLGAAYLAVARTTGAFQGDEHSVAPAE